MAILSPQDGSGVGCRPVLRLAKPGFAHGGEAHMVPMDKTLQDFGVDVQWDDYAQMFTLIKDGAYVKVKPGRKRPSSMEKPWSCRCR